MPAIAHAAPLALLGARRPVAGHAAFLPLHLAFMGLVALAGFAIVALRLYDQRVNHDAIAVGCGGGVLALVLYTRYVLRFPWLSGAIGYLMLLWMFHFGLAFTVVFDPELLARDEERAVVWLYFPAVRIAMVLGLLAAAGFVFGLGLTGRGIRAHAQPTPAELSPRPLAVAGWLLMLGGIGAGVAAMLLNGGFGVLSVDYRTFRRTVLATSMLLPAIQFSQLGCLFAICGARTGRWLVPVLLWSVFGALLLLVGLRNEAMIPLVSFAVILSHRGVRLSRSMLLLALAGALFALPAIKIFRAVGFSNRAEADWSEMSPVATFTELGSTLRAVKSYVEWIDQGDEYQLGASYWAPIDRQVITRLLPDRTPIPFNQDARIPGRMMTSREGATGTASSGEAYYNFGVAGPLLYFSCVGLLFGYLERRATSPYRCAVFSVMLFPFLWNIRSEWIAVPAQVGAGLLLVSCCYAWSLYARARTT